MEPERRISAVVAQGGASLTSTNFKHKLMMEGQRPKQRGGQRVCEILSSDRQHPYVSPVLAVFLGVFPAVNISEGSED